MKNIILIISFLFLSQLTNSQECIDFDSCIKSIEAENIDNQFTIKDIYKKTIKYAKKDEQKLKRVYVSTANNYIIKSQYNSYSKDGFKLAKGLYDKALKIDPDNTEINLKQSYVDENLYDINKAVEFLNKLIKKHPNNASYIWRKGEILYDKCPYEKECRKAGIPFLQRAFNLILEETSKNNIILFYGELTKEKVAVAYLNKLYDLNDSRFYKKEFIKDFLYVNTKIPNTTEWNGKLLLAYLDNNDSINAEKHFKTFSNKITSLKGYLYGDFLSGYKNFKEKKYPEAHEYFKKVNIYTGYTSPTHPLISYYKLLNTYNYNKNLLTKSDLEKFRKVSVNRLIKPGFLNFKDLEKKLVIAIKNKKEEIVIVEKNTTENKNIASTKDLNKLFEYAAEAIKNKNIPNLISAANGLTKVAPENYTGYLYLAFAYCLKNDLPLAKKYLALSRNLNYIDSSNFAIAAYIAFLENDIESTKALMNTSCAIITYENSLPETLKDIVWIEQETGKDCTELKTITTVASKNHPNAVNMMANFNASYADWRNGKDAPKENNIYNYLSKIDTHGAILMNIYKYQKGSLIFYANRLEEGAEIIKKFVNQPKIKNNRNLTYNLASAYNNLADFSHYNYDYENALSESKIGLEHIEGYKTEFLELSLIRYKLNALLGLNKKEEVIASATKLLNISKSLKNDKYELIATNALGQYYVNSPLTSSRNKAYTYLNRAYKLAIKLNDKEKISSISGNYALSLWQKNKKIEALNIANKAITIKEKLNDVNGAQLLANNMGYMYYISKDYNNATKMFTKAINLSEKHLENAEPEMQLALMNEYSSAYSGLIMTYKDTQNVQELFKIQDANRSRLLSKKLHQKAFGKSITDVQNQLTNNDVLIYYSLLSPGEMVATIITKNNATIKYNFPIDKWLQLKKRFVNLVNKKPNTINNYMLKIDEEIIDGQLIKYKDKKQAFSADDFNTFTSLTRELMEASDSKNEQYLNQFLKQWYSFLISPLKNDILGKKNIIISGEAELNYLPFEAFIDDNNQYLLQNYNVTYIPSATVWLKLNERNYASSRQDLLAFGGATYYPPKNKNEIKVRSKVDYYSLKKDLYSNIKNNKNSLTEELTALGYGGANYLPGTLREVENLQKIIPTAKVLTGNNMTESSIKMMNNSGELSNYKWVHIATHGFASDNIPALSGVMMTQNNAEKAKGEDTFLLAHEIEKLNMNADMVTLSACQTALGKIYGGEGINGLNSSLLLAGANNTLLSLWPVNDSGTMVLMTLVYQNMYIKKQTASIALSNAKRSMLNGEYGDQFKTVYMWAPFVLNGLGK